MKYFELGGGRSPSALISFNNLQKLVPNFSNMAVIVLTSLKSDQAIPMKLCSLLNKMTDEVTANELS